MAVLSTTFGVEAQAGGSRQWRIYGEGVVRNGTEASRGVGFHGLAADCVVILQGR